MDRLMKIIKERRSIRNFTKDEVSQESLDLILEAVQWTPSWTNCQCWEVVVVKDKEVKEKLQKAMAKGNPATKAIVEAPVVLAICAKLGVSGYYKKEASTKFGDWFMFDIGMASQNICLAAHKLGLGTVVAGLFDHNSAKECLNLPEGYELVVLIPTGHPAKTPSAPPRREINDFTHSDTF